MTTFRTFGAVVLTAMSLTGAAWAETRGEMRLAHNMPLQHHMHRGAEALAEHFNNNNDRFEIAIFGAGQLYNEKSLVQSIQTGAVEMVFATSGFWSGTAPLVSVIDYPLLFSTYEEARRAFDGVLGDAIAAQIERDNVKVIGFMHYGFNDTLLNSVRPVVAPADFEGLRLRSPNALGAALFAAVGAGSTVLSANEVYMAIQRQTIDGTLTGSTATVQRKFFEVADYATVLPLQYSVQPIVVSMRAWEKLTPEEQQALVDAAQIAEDLTSELAEEEAESSIAQFSSEMEVVRLDAAQIEALRAAAETAADEYITSVAGPEAIDVLKAAKAELAGTN